MEFSDVTFNANDWTGNIHTVKYRTLKNGTVKFKFKGERYKIIFSTSNDDEDPSYSYIDGECFSADMWEFPVVKLCKFLRNKEWTATSDDYINGINRAHKDPVAVVCQILSNVM